MRNYTKLLLIGSLFIFFSCQNKINLEQKDLVSNGEKRNETSRQSNPRFNLPELHVEGQYIKDKEGKIVILRGINTSGDSKVPPFNTLKEHHLNILPKLGFNVLRLLFIWEALEKDRGKYNEEYMAYYENVVRWAAKRNLYVIVDFHQDAFSRYAVEGCGEGFPEWTVPVNMRRKPKNNSDCDSWGAKTFFNIDHNKLWSRFHNNVDGIQTSYLNMTNYVASRMAKHPNVIGYDVINEPWTGGIQEFSNKQLSSLYNKIAIHIRKEHPKSILFIPPHALGSSGLLLFNFRLSKPTFSNFVYAPHYYDPTVIVGKNWLGFKHYERLNRMSNRAKEWNVPLLLGEFGGPAKTKNIEGYTDAIYNWLDNGFHHGTQWNYTPTWNPVTKDGWNNEDLSIVDNKGLRKNFKIRATIKSVAGIPISFKESEKVFSFYWQNNPKLGSTELFVPTNFLEKYKFETNDNISYNIVGNSLYVFSKTNGNISFSFIKK